MSWGDLSKGRSLPTKNLDELSRNVEGHSFRVLKKDCLDLPPKIYQRHFVEMSERQKENVQHNEEGIYC